jgi:hypothetical protein
MVAVHFSSSGGGQAKQLTPETRLAKGQLRNRELNDD